MEILGKSKPDLEREISHSFLEMWKVELKDGREVEGGGGGKWNKKR